MFYKKWYVDIDLLRSQNELVFVVLCSLRNAHMWFLQHSKQEWQLNEFVAKFPEISVLGIVLENIHVTMSFSLYLSQGVEHMTGF